jgi:L-fucose mutarotase/ribose pyranase (RbsD/FucU family)
MIGQKVFVYKNLHKKCYSVKLLKTGRVIAHVDEITLWDASFKVSEAGRQRVIKEKRKNVHAGVVGIVANVNILCQLKGVTYNPYKFDSFIMRDNELPIYNAQVARLDTTGINVALS